MTISLNPSGLVNHLEYSLYKGISRAKVNNQKSIEECITQTDKITEEKSSAYQREAMVMVALAISLFALAAFGIATQWKAESATFDLKCIESDLKNIEKFAISGHPIDVPYSRATQNILNDLGRINPLQITTALKNQMEVLNKEKISFNSTKGYSDILVQFISSAQTIYPICAKISQNQFDHKYQKQNMRYQQLNQERSNLPEQSTLDEVKNMKRRQQQARSSSVG